MSLTRRLSLVAGLLFAALVCQVLLLRHLAEGENATFPEPRAKLADLPTQFNDSDQNSESPALAWLGKEHPGKDTVARQVAFADEVLYRLYHTKDGQSAAIVYAAYSRSGEDRKHHPEICMREVAGVPEDVAARRLIPLGDGAEAQRFRFLTATGEQLSLYYWHYTYPVSPSGRQSALRTIHRNLRTSPPSVSVQVNSHATGPDLEAVERSLLPALDQALRTRVLPEGVLVGHNRIPITMIRR